MDLFHAYSNSGKGGWRCPCCRPGGGFRKVLRRAARRLIRRADRAEWQREGHLQ